MVIYNHGKAVTLDVSPVWPAKPTCGGWQMQINRGIGAEPAEAFDNAKHARGTASQCFLALITSGLGGRMPTSPVIKGITASPWLTCET